MLCVKGWLTLQPSKDESPIFHVNFCPLVGEILAAKVLRNSDR